MKQRQVSPLWIFSVFLLLLTAVAVGFSALSSMWEKTRDADTAPDAPPPLTVIVDAGHGGEDGGAVSASGIVEKDLNLDVAMRLAAYLEAEGVQVIRTRTTDTLLYDRNVDFRGRKKALDLAARCRIARENPNAIFVSIHMNSYPQTQYRGLQVWYSTNDPRSRELAESIQHTVASQLQPENERSVKSATSAIYLLRHITSPAVLVECGFLSNPEEASALATEEYRDRLAFLIARAILQSAEGGAG